MKKAILFLLLLLALLQATFGQTIGEQPSQQNAQLYLFWGNGCSYCAKEKAFLQEQLEQKYPGLQIKQFEVWYDAQNSAFYKQVAEAFGTLDGSSVPRTFIGDKVFVGFAEEQGELIYLPEKRLFWATRTRLKKQ